jgi:tubulin--tyrosine ligase-like protein 12
MNCDEFVTDFEKQNEKFNWTSEVEPKIFKLIRQIFEGASKYPPPKGIFANPQSRAMYAIDLMLDWRSTAASKDQMTIEPMLCEINFMPDCTRACQMYPNFYNTIFETLFNEKNEDASDFVTMI